MLLPPKYEDIILIPSEDDPTPLPPPAYIDSDGEEPTTQAVIN